MHPQRNLIEAAEEIVTGMSRFPQSIAHYGEHPEYGKLYIGGRRRVTNDPERATNAIWDMGLKDDRGMDPRFAQIDHPDRPVAARHPGRSSLHTYFEINGEKILDYRDERHRELMKHVNNTPVNIVPSLER